MEKRPLGRSGLHIAPLALGGNVFGWTADEATSFAILDRFVDLGFSLVDTANVYSTWVPGHKGGESETIIGRWLAEERQARPGARRHEGRHGDRRREGPQARAGRAARRGFAQAPADRSHRSLPDPRRRSRHAGGGNARGARAAGEGGQGARDRRVAVQARSAAGVDRGEQAHGLAALRHAAARVQPLRPRRLRARPVSRSRSNTGSG